MVKESPKEVNEHQVVIYPAMTSSVEGKRIYFLFSLYQVEDIQGDLKVYDVPFSVQFVEGIAVWRDGAIPVISLERYLGMKSAESNRGQRFIVIRSTLRS
ncbi:MAG: chemotaxis protein CheW, partial [Desulfobacterales bacterium]|nr:chemotaxis protein CheW [Desulfobacterales bacterium]